MVSDSIFGLFILEDWKIDLHSQTSSCPCCSVTFSRSSPHSQLMGTPNVSSIGTPPEEGDPPKVSLSNCGVPCLLCHLLSLLTCWEWVFLHSVPQLLTSQSLTSTSEASSSKPCIHPWMLYAVAGVWFVFVVPWGCPGLLAIVLFSMMASAIAWKLSCTVLTVVSTWSSLPAQFTGLAKWNPTSIALPRGSSSLSNHHLKNKIASPGARTTASVIHSSRPSWNMLAINKLVHAWEGGSVSFNDATSSLKSWTTSPVLPASLARDDRGWEIPFWASAPPLVVYLHFPMGAMKSYAFVISLFAQNSLDNLSATLGAKA